MVLESDHSPQKACESGSAWHLFASLAIGVRPFFPENSGEEIEIVVFKLRDTPTLLTDAKRK
jgi:hypothetical protein